MKKRKRKWKRKTDQVNKKHEGPEFSQATMFNVFETVAVDSREVKPGALSIWSELTGQTIPAIMRISLWIKTYPARSDKS